MESNELLSSDISKAAKKFDDEDYEEFLELQRKLKVEKPQKPSTKTDTTISPINNSRGVTALLK